MTSTKKIKPKAVLLENIQKEAVKKFKDKGYTTTLHTGSLDGNDLQKALAKTYLLGIRSKTTITKKVLDGAPCLESIGAYCIGTNQIDLDAATKRGIPVFNAPFSNTRSVVELTLGSIIMLLRKTFDASRNVHEGIWDKSAQGCFEARGKKLGIVGYGKIGSQISVLAEALGMQVYYYDREEKLSLSNATKCATLNELLKTADIVTLHIDGRKENTNLFGAKQFGAMKKGSYFINIARGSVIDVEALARSIKKGHIVGAAIDVFPEEPRGKLRNFTTPLQGLPNVILTPHIGGSTQEAQKSIAEFVSDKLLSYHEVGDTSMSVNFPNLSVPAHFDGCRFLHVHDNVPGVLAAIDNVLADRNVNITGQYLKTNDQVGYVVVDTNAKNKTCAEILNALETLPHTIRSRMLLPR